jgi:oligosaccharyltransferase complex subunit epsilon
MAPSIRQACAKLGKSYLESTPTHIRVLDAFLAYSATTAAILALYCLLVGTFPLNSFISAFMCSLGVFVLTVSLRLQVQGGYSQDTGMANDACMGGRSVERAFVDYLFCVLVLFLAVVNFMG